MLQRSVARWRSTAPAGCPDAPPADSSAGTRSGASRGAQFDAWGRVDRVRFIPMRS
ncbi:conserved hypothetical protein [Ricinus communis]|uniref:Uncharacterized protein n=1 Tax=Ricinus communis TaxID=3988 RepID=B9TNR0_RICCO|nr:conserved hypothetical protein [Ricinus communis]